MSIDILWEFPKKACPCGKEHSVSLSHAIIEKGAIEKIPTYINEFNCKKAFLIADPNTFSAAGEKVCAVLENSSIAYEKYVFSTGCIEPDEISVGSAVMHFDKTCDLVIGIGSGVINDIGKILASITGLPYFIVGTAPSMDGYASATSSMDMDGVKMSLPSKCPDVIIGDIEILKKAPLKMLKSGFGDMVAKYISIAEWRISHEITGEYYCERIAELVRASLKQCVDNATGLLNRNEEAIKAVFEGLVICGAAMSFAKMSRPASGVEHYLSHIWDMRGLEFGTKTESHGIQCAVGTFYALKLYDKLYNFTPDKEKAILHAESFDFTKWSDELRSFVGKGADAMISLEEKEQKYNIAKHRQRLDIICDRWSEILKIIEEELPKISEFEKMLHRLGIPKTLSEIGLEEEIFDMTFKASKDIRDKYVLSRLYWDLGKA